MADTVVSDGLACIQDEGVGSITDGNEDWGSATYRMLLAETEDSPSYVRDDGGLSFTGHDGSADTVDVTAGVAYLDLSGVSLKVQSSRGGSTPPQYDTSVPSGSEPNLPVLVPTNVTGVPLQDSTLSDVWLAYATDGNVSGVSVGDVYIRSDDTGSVTAPPHPNVKIGSANPDDATADTFSNDGASVTRASADVDDQTVTDTWNNAIVAYPGETTIQQAFNAATDGDTVVIVGSHDEAGISIPNTRMDVIWWGDAVVKNTKTDGTNTFNYPSISGAINQRWYRPKGEGNASSGAFFSCPDFGTVDANQPNIMGIVHPRVVDHGGPAFKLADPVSTTIDGVCGAVVQNNGQADTTSVNIDIDRGVNTSVKRVFLSQADRDIQWVDAGGCEVGEIIFQSYDEHALHLEGWFNGTLSGPIWFEGAGTGDTDIFWGTGSRSGSGMRSRSTVQTGSIHWAESIEFPNGAAGGSLLFHDTQAIQNANQPANVYEVAGLPEYSGDPNGRIQNSAYIYLDTTGPSLKVKDSSGTITSF